VLFSRRISILTFPLLLYSVTDRSHDECHFEEVTSPGAVAPDFTTVTNPATVVKVLHCSQEQRMVENFADIVLKCASGDCGAIQVRRLPYAADAPSWRRSFRASLTDWESLSRV
jgi:hypothetical protein